MVSVCLNHLWHKDSEKADSTRRRRESARSRRGLPSRLHPHWLSIGDMKKGVDPSTPFSLGLMFFGYMQSANKKSKLLKLTPSPLFTTQAIGLPNSCLFQ